MTQTLEDRSAGQTAVTPAALHWVQCKTSAIRIRDGKLILSNENGNTPMVVQLPWKAPVLAELGWTSMDYELWAVYSRPAAEPVAEGAQPGRTWAMFIWP